MNAAKNVIQKFGGQSALAALLGKRQSTVQHWAKVGRIPAKWQPELLRLAEDNGVDLYFGDFISQEQTAPAKGKRPSLSESRWWGTLIIGHWEIPCYVLVDGRRVLGRTGAAAVLTDEKGETKGSGPMESLLEAKALKPHLPPGHSADPIALTLPEAKNKKIQGILAEAFLGICRAYIHAREEGELSTPKELAAARQAAKFLAVVAEVGLMALIGEATGYQYDRIQDALRLKTMAYTKDGLQKWEKTFPNEMWETFGRLTKWNGASDSRPPYWEQLVVELVYGYLEKDVVDWLKHNDPRPRNGSSPHQWLRSQYGLRELTEHIWMLVGMAKTCNTMLELRQRMAEQFGREPIHMTLFLHPPGRAGWKLPVRRPE